MFTYVFHAIETGVQSRSEFSSMGEVYVLPPNSMSTYDILDVTVDA